MIVAPLKYLSKLPITNGLGLAGAHTNSSWPRYIRTTDIAGPHSLREDTFASQPPETASAALVSQGDILMTAAGASIGKSTTFHDDYAACYAGFLVRVRPKSQPIGRYLAYWMQSDHYWGQVRAGAVKSTIENFSASKYRALLVPAYAESAYDNIADYLDRETAQIDTLIAKQEQLIATLRERRDAAWAETFVQAQTQFGTTRLRRLVDSITDGPFGSSLTSKHYVDGGARVVRLGNIGVNEFRASDQAWVPLGYYEVLKPHSVRAGDVVVAGLGDERMPLGRAAVVPEIGPAIVKADCYRIRPAHRVRPDYLAWALSSPPVREQFKLMARGSTRSRLNTTVVLEAHIPAPPLGAQDEIVSQSASALASIDTLIAKAERFIELSKERRAALITAAVTGQLEIPG